VKNIIKYLEYKYGNKSGGSKVLKRNSKRLRKRINKELIDEELDYYYKKKDTKK
jgi:hypothetical protein